MNCKQGDLAILICDPKFDGADLGKLVEILCPGQESDCWLCLDLSGRMKWINGDDCPGEPPNQGDIPDAWLRPIRPNEGEDETLRWAGKPLEVATKDLYDCMPFRAASLVLARRLVLTRTCELLDAQL